jgi:hypothetical protein
MAAGEPWLAEQEIVVLASRPPSARFAGEFGPVVGDFLTPYPTGTSGQTNMLLVSVAPLRHNAQRGI